MEAISLRAQTIFHIGTFAVTNSLLLSATTLIFLLYAGLLVRRSVRMVPRGLQNIAELFIEGATDFMASVLGSKRKAEEYFPLVATIFLFVVFSNWLGLLPGIGSV